MKVEELFVMPTGAVVHYQGIPVRLVSNPLVTTAPENGKMLGLTPLVSQPGEAVRYETIPTPRAVMWWWQISLATVVLLAVVMFLAGCASAPPADKPPKVVQMAKVIRIIDADTIELDTPRAAGITNRDRLIGVDAPETGRGRPKEPCSQEATEALYAMIPPGTVVMYETAGIDGFRRPLVYLWTKDGSFVNADIVSTGWANSDKAPHKRKSPLDNAQAAAQSGNRGAWGNPPCKAQR